jgi:hypothetical protein
LGAGSYTWLVNCTDLNGLESSSALFSLTTTSISVPSGPGGSTSYCQDECELEQLGTKYCFEGNAYECGSFDRDNCRDSIITQVCLFHEQCVEGECICTENWWCEGWSKCYPSEEQWRECVDIHSCGTEERKPKELRGCAYTPTCHDGIHNDDEEGVDCGGPCRPCLIEEEAVEIVSITLIGRLGLVFPIFVYLLILIAFILSLIYTVRKFIEEEWTSYKWNAWIYSIIALSAIMTVLYKISYGADLPLALFAVVFVTWYMLLLDVYAKVSGLNMKLESYRATASIKEITVRLGLINKVMERASQFKAGAGRLFSGIKNGLKKDFERSKKALERDTDELGEISEKLEMEKLKEIKRKLKKIRKIK